MRFLFPILALSVAFPAAAADKIKVVIIDGQNNHKWQETTPVLKKELDDAGLFEVTVATSPAQGKKEEMAKFNPDLSKCDVLVSNYNGEQWSKELNEQLDSRLKDGKMGLVIVHAANNAFGGWKEFNQMIGMGWRDAKFGKRLKVDDQGKEQVVEAGQDRGSGHTYTGPFTVTVRDTDHPVTKGMPKEWLHNNDELYDNIAGAGRERSPAGHRVPAGRQEGERGARADDLDGGLRQGAGVPHPDGARRERHAVRRVRRHPHPRHRVGGHRQGDAEAARELPHRRQEERAAGEVRPE